MIDYKKLYFKYKNKYLQKKKIYGGSSDKEIKKFEKIYEEHMKKLVNLKNKYQVKFNKGLDQKQVFEFLKEIQKMGEDIEKMGYSLNQQKAFLEAKYPLINNYNMRDLNYILIHQIIREYLNNTPNNSLEELVKYLEKNKIPLKNKELCKYKTGELLGQGVFGAVYKLPQNKVLKVINATNYVIPEEKKPDEYGEGLDQIINEIRSMEKMNKTNPPISPKIYDYWMSNNNNSLQIYIVMEFKGQALWGWLQKKNRGLTDKEEKVIEEKIKKMHNAGVVHTDLHLNNILVEEIKGKTEFFIADFGLSKTKQTLFDTIKKNDYTRWKDFYSKYNQLRGFLEYIVEILDIKIIKM